MGIRLVEGGVALGFGAADAILAAKVPTKGPAGISWPVYLEGAGIAAGVFGDKVGLPSEVRDSVFLSALALAGARLGKAAVTGKLMQGPKAWGGDFIADAGVGGSGHHQASVRLLPGGARGGDGQYVYSSSEAPGVAG